MSRKQIASCSVLHNLPNYSASLFTADMFIRSIISQEGSEWNLMMSYCMYVSVECLYLCRTVQMTEHFFMKGSKTLCEQDFPTIKYIYSSYNTILQVQTAAANI